MVTPRRPRAPGTPRGRQPASRGRSSAARRLAVLSCGGYRTKAQDRRRSDRVSPASSTGSWRAAGSGGRHGRWKQSSTASSRSACTCTIAASTRSAPGSSAATATARRRPGVRRPRRAEPPLRSRALNPPSPAQGQVHADPAEVGGTTRRGIGCTPPRALPRAACWTRRLRIPDHRRAHAHGHRQDPGSSEAVEQAFVLNLIGHACRMPCGGRTGSRPGGASADPRPPARRHPLTGELERHFLRLVADAGCRLRW